VFAVRAQAKKVITDADARDIVNIYRTTHRHVVNFWKRCGDALDAIYEGRYGVAVDRRGIVTTCKDGLLLPSGLVIKYRDLQRKWKPHENGGRGRWEWTYFNGKTRERIYGGKVCENIIQGLARIVVLYQCLLVPYTRKLVMSSHDEGVWCVPEEEAEATKKEVEKALRVPLDWCADLPLNCEVGFHKIYGKAKQ
jgi:hypothetical protein